MIAHSLKYTLRQLVRSSSIRLKPINPIIYYSTLSNDTLNLLQRIKGELKTSMRAKDKMKTTLIKTILSDILYTEKNLGRSIVEDSDIIPILMKAIKKREEAIIQYKQGNRQDLVESEQLELNVLKGYLPEMLSDDEIEIEVKRVVNELKVDGVKQMGKVMQQINLDPAKAPKAKVAQVVKKVLENLN